MEVDLNDEPSLVNVFKVSKKKEPKRILHFSDGTMEEYDTDDSDEELAQSDGVEEPFRKAKEREVESAPPVDPVIIFFYYCVFCMIKNFYILNIL